jgi:hypothetical protein
MVLKEPETIAHKMILWRKRGGKEVIIQIIVGKPYRVSDDEWKCPVQMDSVDGRYADISGCDSLQSICLALALVRTRLSHLLEDGETLFFPEGKIPYTKRSLNIDFGVPRRSRSKA